VSAGRAAAPPVHEIPAEVPGKSRTALFSVLAAVGLALAKLIVGLMTGSLALLADAIHSGIDTLASAITLYAVRVADRPADADHPYGHGRAENLGALAETILLSVMGALVLAAAYRRIVLNPDPPAVSAWVIALVMVAIVVDYWRVRALRRAAAHHHSAALEANAAHFENDLISSCLVLLALGTVYFGPGIGIPAAVTDRADAFGAVIVALLAFRIALKLGSKSVHALMDAVPTEVSDRLGDTVEGVDGVMPGSSRVRSRFLGETPYIDVALAVQPTASIQEAHAVTEAVEAAIRQDHPQADIVVHVRPGPLSAEAHVAAVRAVANRMTVSVHNVQVLLLSDGLQVDLDLELPAGISLREAHECSERLERALHESMPEVRSIGIHLEPRVGRTIPAARHPEMAARVRAELATVLDTQRIGGVDVALTDQGSMVSIRVRFDAEASLEAVHDEMAEIEAAVQARIPGLARVRIDPEPE
jgi:cation diffusion facilitator family transporter